jgi:hypothetical protein
MMNADRASAYLDLSKTKFLEGVDRRFWPQPKNADGSPRWDRRDLDAAVDALSDRERAARGWDRVTNDSAATTCTPELIRNRLRKLQGTLDYDADAYERWLIHEITFAELPPGNYPNGLRVYADGEWEDLVRKSPLTKLERAALGAYARAKGTIGYVKGAGPATNDRLMARGFIVVVQEREAGRSSYHGITPAGEAEWLRIAGTKPK